MWMIVTNISGRTINTPSTNGVATGGTLQDPLPHPFQYVGPMLPGATIQLPIRSDDMRYRESQSSVEAQVEWDTLIQKKVVAVSYQPNGVQGTEAELGANQPVSSTGMTQWSDLSLFVSPTGSDVNEGSSGAPFLTIQAALNSYPQQQSSVVTIQLAAGTYAPFTVNKHFLSNSAKLLIKCDAWATPVLTSGPLSGVFDGNTSNFVASLSTANWTPNELRGKFLKVTDGWAAGAVYPIVSNTATEVEVPTYVQWELVGYGFEIVEPGAVVLQPATSSTSVAVLEATTGSVRYPNSQASTVVGPIIQGVSIKGGRRGVVVSNQLSLVNCDIREQTGVAAYGLFSDSLSQTNLFGCGIKGTTTSYSVWGSQANLTLSASYINTNGTFFSGGPILSGASQLRIDRLFIDGGGVGYGLAGTGSSEVIVTGSTLVIRDCLSGGLQFPGTVKFSADSVYLTNVGDPDYGWAGVSLSGSSDFQAQQFVMDGVTGYGIYTDSWSSGTAIEIAGGTIKNCTKSGVHLDGMNHSFQLYGNLFESSYLQDNGQWGANAVGSHRASHNKVHVNEYVVMSGNVFGDFPADHSRYRASDGDATSTAPNIIDSATGGFAAADIGRICYLANATEFRLDYDAETANFNIGATLEGQTSGAHATILAVNDAGATGTLIIEPWFDADFLEDEIITDDGGVPGSATVDGVRYTVSDTGFYKVATAPSGTQITVTNVDGSPAALNGITTGTPAITIIAPPTSLAALRAVVGPPRRTILDDKWYSLISEELPFCV